MISLIKRWGFLDRSDPKYTSPKDAKFAQPGKTPGSYILHHIQHAVMTLLLVKCLGLIVMRL